MTTIPQVSQALHTVLTTATTQAAHDLHYTKRPDRATFCPSTLVQTLVLGWLAHPSATLERLSQMAARVGAAVSPQAIDQRFTFDTAALLRAVLTATLHHVIAADPVALPLLQRFTGVWVHDGTTIALPDALADSWRGCGGSTAVGTTAALKCGVQWDILTGALTALDLAAGRTHDSALPCQQRPLPIGSLRLADLGFFNLQRLAELDHQGVYWLTKIRPTVCVRTPDQQRQPLSTFVVQQASHGYDGWVHIGRDHPIQARILVQPVPQEVADQRRRRIRQAAQDKGTLPSAAALTLAAWTILITNVSSSRLSRSEALGIMKVRWQIELLFKLWKSHGQLATWRTAKPARILCEIYAKLIAMVLQHWILVVGCWAYPDRSFVKAAQVVRDHATDLACAQADPARFTAVLTTIQHVLVRTARMNPRRTQPNTYQHLGTLTTDAEA